MDAALIWNPNGYADIALSGGDLAHDDGLETAVILSLFCDARADADDSLDAGADPRGYWGDSFAAIAGDVTGSKLWLIVRQKQLADVANRAQEYAAAALAWLVEDGIAATVNVIAEWIAQGTLALSIAIAKPGSNDVFQRRYQYVWSAL
ncbi:MAG: phage GP46 family protein [Gammaproteobacteria bacterium]